MNVKKNLAIVILSLMTVATVATPASALVKPNSFYDAVAWTWEYNAPATSTYNCLAYALGYTDRWMWAWGASNPTSSQVNYYMDLVGGYRNVGYGTPINNPLIISYGSSSAVVHFSKVTGSGITTAKWGELERMKSYSLNPYNPGGGYGPAVTTYY
ncbi:hypothetical protein E4K67_27570 [Desulfosporosinus fructosivorans]|uniref:DUF7689 domain-containing protein n=2 Tax=Desulfosporosinus fructosivorans TaxID=2018669 RepID=A0A4Z0R070_9FIRM|nr:hypothetical protein E4K67_27570 [Desulfosporosinus fructosivorans]